MVLIRANKRFFASKEARRIQESWEPEFGDRVQIVFSGHVGTVVYYNAEYNHLCLVFEGDIMISHWAKTSCSWLPYFNQLQKMLMEERYGLSHLGDERFHPDFDGRDWDPEEPYRALGQGKEPGDYVKGTGPTPAIALGRALLEAMKHAAVR